MISQPIALIIFLHFRSVGAISIVIATWLASEPSGLPRRFSSPVTKSHSVPCNTKKYVHSIFKKIILRFFEEKTTKTTVTHLCVTLLKHFHSQKFQWATIDTRFRLEKSLHCSICFAGIRWTCMKNDFSYFATRLWIPRRWICQIGYFLQIVHAIQMREYLFSML